MTDQQDNSLHDAYSATTQKCHDIEQYLHELRKRLYAGKNEYADNSSDLPTSTIERERLEEALDVAGWSYVMWRKLRHMAERQNLERLMNQPVTETPSEDKAPAVAVDPTKLVDLIVEDITANSKLHEVDQQYAVLMADVAESLRRCLCYNTMDEARERVGQAIADAQSDA